MSVECITGPRIEVQQFAKALLNNELPIAGDPEPLQPLKRRRTLLDRIPAALLRVVPPVALALGLSSGVHTVRAQEPTPQDTDPGIRITCDEHANCTTTVGKQSDMYRGVPPFNTGDVANTAVGADLIYPSQANACANAFEKENPLYLVDDPDGDRMNIHIPGMTFPLPDSCTLRLFKEKDTLREEIKPSTQLPDLQTPMQQETPSQPGKLWDCLGSIGVFMGFLGLANWSIRQKYRTGR